MTIRVERPSPALDAEVTHVEESRGKRVQGFVPRNSLPVSLTARAGPPQGIKQPILVVGQIGKPANALDAESASRSRMLRVGLDLRYAVVLDCYKRAAMGAAFPACGGVDLAFRCHGTPIEANRMIFNLSQGRGPFPRIRFQDQVCGW